MAACVEATGAVGAGLSLSRGLGLREPVLAVGEQSEELEELQFTLGQGPAVDAVGGDRPVLMPDLTDPAAERRWPVFAPAAVARDVRAVFAFPVAAGAARLGVLDVYRRAPGRLSPSELRDALAFADIVLVLALDQRSGLSFDVDELADSGLPERRAEVHQAAGMVSVQLGVGVAEALTRLRAYAYLQEQRLADVAADLIARRVRFEPDGDPGRWMGIDGKDPMDPPPSTNDNGTEGEG
jgi:GAF domain-containing protein